MGPAWAATPKGDADATMIATTPAASPGTAVRHDTLYDGSLLAVFASLKWRLLTHGFHASKRSRLASIGLLVMSVGGGSVLGYSFVKDYRDGPVAWSRSLIPGFTAIFLAWVFGPILLGGVDDSLDPRRLSLLPLRRGELGRGLTVGALIGYLPVGTVLALAGVVVAYAVPATSWPARLLIALACIAHIALCFSAGRLLAVGLAFATTTRRGRDISVIAASLAAALLWLSTQSLGTIDERHYDAMIGAMRWFPPGMLASAVIDAIEGDLVNGAARVVVIAVAAIVLARWWVRATEALGIRPAARDQRTTRSDSVGALLRLIARGVILLGGPRAGAVFVKEARYLARSPSRRSALVVSTVMGVPFVLLQTLRSSGFVPGSVAYAPVALLFGLGTVNNLVGSDARSLWLEVSSGASLRELLVGRGVAAIPYLVFPSLTAALILAALSRSTHALAVVVVIVLFAWGVPLGIGTYLSVRAPYAQNDDANPFSNTRSSAGVSGAFVLAVAFIGTGLVAVLGAPLGGVGWWALHRGAGGFAVLFVAAGAYGMASWLVGVHLACRHVARGGVDLVGTLGSRGAVS